MKLVSKETINAPASEIWAKLTDTPLLENWVQSHNVPLNRTDDGTKVKPGTAWTAPIASGLVRGTITAKIIKAIPGKRLVIRANIRGVEATMRLNLKEQSATSTLLRVGTQLKNDSMLGQVAMLAIRAKKEALAHRHQTSVQNLAERISSN